jgi:hypothetical protein
MAGRPGFFGALRQGDADRGPEFGADSEPLTLSMPVIRFGDPEPRGNGLPGFDPIWGTLGPPASPTAEQWSSNDTDPELDGPAVDVEMFGDGFQITGRLHTGQFDRLSDWLNMQTGFIKVQDASLTRLGRANGPDPDNQRGMLWVRLNQVVFIAERALVQQARPGAVVVQKQRRTVTAVTPGYTLHGNLHVHAHGSMKQYLESPDPRFIPLTDVSVRWLSDPTLMNRFPFGLINRDQLITVLDDPAAGTVESPDADAEEPEHAMPLQRRWGAA